VCVRQQAYRRRSALRSHRCGLPKGANICPDCLYVLGILLLGSLGPDKLRQRSEGYLEGYNRGGKEGEYGGALLVYIKRSLL